MTFPQDTSEEMPPYSYEFTLTLTVKGKRLQDIDDGLVQAAGERLKARMSAPLKMPELNPQTPQAPASAAEPSTATPPSAISSNTIKSPTIGKTTSPIAPPTDSLEPAKRKPGRPPNPLKKPAPEKVTNPVVAATNNNAVETAAPTGNVYDEMEVVEPAVEAPAAPTKPATLAEAVAALTLVNSTFNIDKARECLNHFGVKRCGDLPDARRAEFVAYCESLCRG